MTKYQEIERLITGLRCKVCNGEGKLAINPVAGEPISWAECSTCEGTGLRIPSMDITIVFDITPGEK